MPYAIVSTSTETCMLEEAHNHVLCVSKSQKDLEYDAKLFVER
jgi:hypothetical protein